MAPTYSHPNVIGVCDTIHDLRLSLQAVISPQFIVDALCDKIAISQHIVRLVAMNVDVAPNRLFRVEVLHVVLGARHIIEVIHERLAPWHANATVQPIMAIETLFVRRIFLKAKRTKLSLIGMELAISSGPRAKPLATQLGSDSDNAIHTVTGDKLGK